MHDNIGQQEKITALAARFIAETNAFLEQFWTNPAVGWPLKRSARAASQLPQEAAPACAGPLQLPDPVPPIGLAAAQELRAMLKWLYQRRLLGANAAAAAPDSEPGVYLFLLLVLPQPGLLKVTPVTKSKRPCQVDSAKDRSQIDRPPSTHFLPRPRGSGPENQARRRARSSV
jgi:hypothetical protein